MFGNDSDHQTIIAIEPDGTLRPLVVDKQILDLWSEMTRTRHGKLAHRRRLWAAVGIDG